jgi:hypothetical protein
MMLGQAESGVQRQYANPVSQNVIPELADLRQKYQPDGGKKYKKRDGDNQIHRTKAEVGERAMHGNHTAAMSTRRERICQRSGFQVLRRVLAMLKIHGRIQS